MDTKIKKGFTALTPELVTWINAGLTAVGGSTRGLADEAGVPGPTMSNYKLGRVPSINNKNLRGIARAFAKHGFAGPEGEKTEEKPLSGTDALHTGIRVYKARHGLSNAGMAERFGVSKSTIERFLRLDGPLRKATTAHLLLAFKRLQLEEKKDDGSIKTAARPAVKVPELSTTVSLQEVVPNKLSIIPPAFAMTEAELDMREMEIITRMRSRLSVPAIVASNGISKR